MALSGGPCWWSVTCRGRAGRRCTQIPRARRRGSAADCGRRRRTSRRAAGSEASRGRSRSSTMPCRSALPNSEYSKLYSRTQSFIPAGLPSSERCLPHSHEPSEQELRETKAKLEQQLLERDQAIQRMSSEQELRDAKAEQAGAASPRAQSWRGARAHRGGEQGACTLASVATHTHEPPSPAPRSRSCAMPRASWSAALSSTRSWSDSCGLRWTPTAWPCTP